MERYREYKDSGVQWLGEIPSHWGVVRLKRISSMKSGDNITALDIADNGDFPVYGANGFRGYYGSYNKEGSYLLIGRQGALAGNVHLVSGKFWATDHAIVTTISHNQSIGYMYYALKAMNLNQYAFDTAAQPGLAVSKIINMSTALPPLPEQHSIVSYLDTKCEKLDKMVEGKEKQIALLQELKQRTIADAVTRGLNPDVKFKKTDLNWINEIPEHWRVVQFKGLFKIVKNIAGKLGYDVISVTQLGLKVKDINSNIGQLAADYSKYQMVEPNDFAMNHMDLLTGFIGLSTIEGVTSPDYRVFRNISPKANNDYYLRIFEICYKCKIFYGLGQGVANVGRWRLPAKNLQKFILPLPPLEEQQAIVSHINERTTKIDTLATKLRQEIEAIKEYKQRLISDVVTGQIKVG